MDNSFYVSGGKASAICINDNVCDDEVEIILGENYELIQSEDGTIKFKKKSKRLTEDYYSKYPSTLKDCSGYVPTVGITCNVPVVHKEAIIALAMLLEIRDTWWEIYGSWDPRELPTSYVFVISTKRDLITGKRQLVVESGMSEYVNRVLVFPNSILRDKFLKCFYHLIELAIDLI